MRLERKSDAFTSSGQNNQGVYLETLLITENTSEEIVKNQRTPENYTVNMKVNIKPQRYIPMSGRNINHNINGNKDLKKDILVISEEIIQNKEQNNKVNYFY
jgi:hypothetical protein